MVRIFGILTGLFFVVACCGRSSPAPTAAITEPAAETVEHAFTSTRRR
jgi:hypothetical protein